MVSKITRRVALGTLLGSMVACPFVVRSIRRNKTVDLPSPEEHRRAVIDAALNHPNPRVREQVRQRLRELQIRDEGIIKLKEKFVADWKELMTGWLSFPERIGGDSSLSELRLNLSQPDIFEFKYVTYLSPTPIETLEQCEEVVLYETVFGKVKIDAEIPMVRVTSEIRRSSSFALDEKGELTVQNVSKPTAAINLVPKRNRKIYADYEDKQGGQKNVDILEKTASRLLPFFIDKKIAEEISMFGLPVNNCLTYPYPIGQAKVNGVWEYSEEEAMMYKSACGWYLLPTKVEAFGRLDGRDVVIVRSKSTMDLRAMQDIERRFNRFLTRFGGEPTSAVGNIKDQGTQEHFTMTRCIDLQTGLCTSVDVVCKTVSGSGKGSTLFTNFRMIPVAG
jgi:hypothetical protein